MFNLRKLSIAAKLYSIFALLGIVTLFLGTVAAWNANQQLALTSDFESAFLGAQNVERVNALIYAVVMESRGIYMSPDTQTAKKFGDGLLKFNDQIGEVVKMITAIAWIKPPVETQKLSVLHPRSAS